VVGGGVIGVEMAFLYAQLGVQVTVLEAENAFCP
jgi:pyruvate/2-oxoglutarate dehydrogenase complex dihydrolipoamide dehydrogenase (E3) component